MSYYECIGHSQAELDASYSNGYSAGVTAADNRANSSSTNYKTGYNSGYSAGVSDTKKGTATASQVLSGYTFTNSSSVNASGTMTNNGAKTYTINPGGKQTIPAGYHNGSGYVQANTAKANGTLTVVATLKATAYCYTDGNYRTEKSDTSDITVTVVIKDGAVSSKTISGGSTYIMTDTVDANTFASWAHGRCATSVSIKSVTWTAS